MPPTVIHILVYLIIGNMLWQKVLKKSAYPNTIPNQLKWLHGIILFVIDTSAWIAFIGFLHWIFSCFHFGSTGIADPLILAAMLITGLSAMFLMKICNQMANRKKSILKWYFVMFPLYFISATFLQIAQSRIIITMQTLVVSVAFEIIIFSLAIIFYVKSSTTKALFDTKDDANKPCDNRPPSPSN
jgi:hypothetical protein